MSEILLSNQIQFGHRVVGIMGELVAITRAISVLAKDLGDLSEDLHARSEQNALDAGLGAEVRKAKELEEERAQEDARRLQAVKSARINAAKQLLEAAEREAVNYRGKGVSVSLSVDEALSVVREAFSPEAISRG